MGTWLGRFAVIVAVALAGLIAVSPEARAAPAPGTLDSGFGTGGISSDQFGLGTPPNSAGDSVVVAPDGDIYVAGGIIGSASSSDYEAFVARYLPSGSLDPSFGSGGVAIENVGLGTTPQTGSDSLSVYGGVLPLVLAPNGDPIIGATASDSSGNPEIAVFELTTSGLLDPAFGTAGVYRQQLGATTTYSSPSTQVFGMAMQSDGEPVITGAASTASGEDQFFAERLTGAGDLDTSFDSAGATPGVYEHQYGLDPTAASSGGNSVVAEADGNLTFSGVTDDVNGDSEFLILRLTPAGTPDPAFDAGAVEPSPAGQADGEALAQLPGGGYVVAGSAYDADDDDAIAVVAFTSGGRVNSSFATAGIYSQQLAPTAGETTIQNLEVQPDGKIDLDATIGGAEGGPAAILRLLPDGTLDSSFGTGGVFEPQFGTGASPYSDVFGGALAPDGDLLLVGDASTATTQETQSFLSAVVTDTPPTVSFSVSPAAPRTGQSVSFSAGATASSGAAIASYSWDLGTGDFSDATGARVTKTFSTAGTDTVRVKVTDSDGLSTISSQTITVAGATTGQSGTTAPSAARAGLRIIALRRSAGGATVKLTCAKLACHGTVSLTAVEHLKQRTVKLRLGSARYRLAAGRSRLVTITLDAAGRKLLAKRHRLSVTVAVTLAGATPTIVATRKLTLVRAKVTKQR